MSNPDPSSSLHTKLQTILEDWYPGTQYNEVIPMLVQAFQDEGYRKTTMPSSKDPRGKDVMWMTGPEWFSRFKAELDSTFFLTWHENGKGNEAHEILDREQVRKIAAKAAGVSDE